MFTKICTKTSLVVKIEDHNNTSYDKHYVISKLGLSKATIVIPLSFFMDILVTIIYPTTSQNQDSATNVRNFREDQIPNIESSNQDTKELSWK